MKKFGIVSIIAILLVITACSQGNNNQSENSEMKASPFTGKETTEDVTNRAIAVMVSNQKQARPQSGLSKADIVFEMLTEGNITRFLAIYQSTEPEVVGPVRSAREYFFTLASGYDAIYVYHGADDFINDMIISQGIDHLSGANHDNDGNLFVRETFRKAPHNSYFQFGAAYNAAKQKGYEIKQEHEPFLFLEEDEEIGGEEADGARITYSPNEPVVEFHYDESDQKYTRVNDGETTIELESEMPIQIDNVLIVEAEHRVIDDQKRRFIDIESGGPAYLLQRGKVQKIQWENRDGRIIPVDDDGQVVPFVQGQTWINFIPSTPPQHVTEQVQFLNND